MIPPYVNEEEVMQRERSVVYQILFIRPTLSTSSPNRFIKLENQNPRQKKKKKYRFSKTPKMSGIDFVLFFMYFDSVSFLFRHFSTNKKNLTVIHMYLMRLYNMLVKKCCSRMTQRAMMMQFLWIVLIFERWNVKHPWLSQWRKTGNGDITFYLAP